MTEKNGSTTERREMMADVAQTARLGERQENAKTHAAKLSAMFDAPVFKQVPKREWRTHYWVSGVMYGVLLVQALEVMSTPQGPAPKIQVQVTCHHDTYPHSVKFMGLMGDYDVMDIVVFLGLDALSPDAVSWRDVTRYRNLLTVEGLVARSTTRPLN